MIGLAVRLGTLGSSTDPFDGLSSKEEAVVRVGLIGGVLVGMLLVAVAMARYPGSGPTTTSYLAEGVIAFLILAGLGVWLARWAIPATERGATDSARGAASVGLILGLLWVFEISF